MKIKKFLNNDLLLEAETADELVDLIVLNDYLKYLNLHHRKGSHLNVYGKYMNLSQRSITELRSMMEFLNTYVELDLSTIELHEKDKELLEERK